MSFLNSSCSFLTNDKKQTIHVKALDISNKDNITECKCTIHGDNKDYDLKSNPGIVEIENQNIVIRCKKDGYNQIKVVAGDSFTDTDMNNPLSWPSFLLDSINKPYQKYYSHYLVYMEKNSRK